MKNRNENSVEAESAAEQLSGTLPDTLRDPTNFLHLLDAIDQDEADVQILEPRGNVEMVVRHDLHPQTSLFTGSHPDEVPYLRLSPDRLISLRSLVAKAYDDVRDGCSVDLLLADVMLNDLFLRRCWELGAIATPFDLNWVLLNLRKSGKLVSREATKSFVFPPKRFDEIGYACEFALRYVQDREYARGRDISLDRLLCDRALASEFEAVVQRMVPQYSSLDYRWIALTIRKARRFSNKTAAKFETVGRTNRLCVARLPTSAGLFRFADEKGSVYVGETNDLRGQISCIFDRLGTTVVPEWLLEQRIKGLELSIIPVDESRPKRNLIKTSVTDLLNPRLNWLGTHTLWAA